MSAVLARPAPALGAAGMGLKTVDHVYRSKPYRLAEPIRGAGASVRPAEAPLWCEACGRPVRPAVKGIRLANRTSWVCIPCGIRSGLLVPAALAPLGGAEGASDG